LMCFVSIAYLFVAPNMLNLGSIGIAYSLFIANIILGVMFFYFAKRNFRELNLFPSKKKFIYGFIVGLSGYLFYNFSLNSMILKLVFLLAFLIFYWIFAFIFSVITKEDWQMVFDVLNIKKMNTYVKSEIIPKKKISNK